MSEIFAIDFTSEEMTAAFVSRDGVPRETAGFDLSDFLAGESSPLDKLVGLLAAKSRMSGSDIEATVITMPCDLDAKREKVVHFPQAPWLNGRLLPAILHETLGVPVLMERRSLAMLEFDLAMLGIPAEAVAIGCYIDLQYDVSIWHNGNPVVGHNGRAGNIMHLPVQDREDMCYCGRVGCAGLYGTGLRLRQIHSMIFPDTPMEELFEEHGDHPIVLDFLRMMAYPIAMSVNFSDPDFLVLGGDVVGMRGFPRDVLEGEIRKAVYRPGDGGATIMSSTVGELVPAVVCGAQYAMKKLPKSEEEPRGIA